MHILATFATLCCQTRWPRNHSCTTQEHVSFFSDIFGNTSKTDGTESDIFGNFDFFRLFLDFRQKCQNSAKNMCTKKFTCACLCEKEIHECVHVQKLFHNSANPQKHVVHKSDKCAKRRKCVVHKMRKSAAQIIF